MRPHLRFAGKGCEVVYQSNWSNSPSLIISALPTALSMRRYGFNAGSTQCFYGCMQVAATIAVNTTLATGESHTEPNVL